MHNPTTFPSLSLFTHFPFTFSFIFQQEGEATIEDIPLRRVARTQPQPEIGQKVFTCGRCGATFARRDYLQVHLRIHTGNFFELLILLLSKLWVHLIDRF